MPIDVSILEKADPACDEFLKSRHEAAIYHTYGWSEAVRRAYNYRPYYLVARENQTIRGVLPLAYVRSIIFGNRMVSQAHSNYGGPIADSSQALDSLYNRAVELAKEHKCDSIEFRNVNPLPYKELFLRSDKISMRLPLIADPEALWKSFRKDTKVRNLVSKGQKAGIVTVSGGLELLDDFYRLYTIRVHQLGSPCYSKRLMRAILEILPENSRIFVACLGDVTIAAKFIVNFNDCIESCWGATLVEYNHLSPNHTLFWAVMKHYCVRNVKWLDFGRSTVDTRHYDFKKRWGAEEIPLHYQYWVRPGHQLSIASPDNPKYKTKIEIWKRLPLWATRLIGPYISRGLP
jgi:FemAB-related protein (PEP-CTERM system-associated)